MLDCGNMAATAMAHCGHGGVLATQEIGFKCVMFF